VTAASTISTLPSFIAHCSLPTFSPAIASRTAWNTSCSATSRSPPSPLSGTSHTWALFSWTAYTLRTPSPPTAAPAALDAGCATASARMPALGSTVLVPKTADHTLPAQPTARSSGRAASVARPPCDTMLSAKTRDWDVAAR